MSLEIKKLPEPDEGVMLVSTEAYNRLVDALNALLLMQVKPQGVGKLLVGDKNAILDLSGIEQYVVQLVQAVQNGGAGGGSSAGGGSGGGSGGNPPVGGGGGGGGLPPEFEQRLNNMSFAGKCNGDGTFTITGSI